MIASQDREFHGQQYTIKISQQNDTMVIDLEQRFEIGQWKNQFTKQYIEDLTQKTGHRRAFNDFTILLTQAIKQENSSNISMDILTYQDLENMKAKKQGLPNPQPSQLNTVQLKANKRYIILSVSTTTQNDKVHYPLTLNFEEVNDVDKLKQTLRLLKSELDDVRSSRDNFSGIHSQSQKESFFITENTDKKLMNSTNSSIQSQASEYVLQENEILRTKVKRLEESFQQKQGALEVDSLMKSKLDLEIQNDTLRIQSSREISRLEKTLDEREQELVRQRKQVLQVSSDLSQSLPPELLSQKLRETIDKVAQQTEREVLSSRKTIHTLQKENEKALTEIDFFKKADQKNKNRIRQLEIELETAVKRGSKVADRLYSPYNNTNARNTTGARRTGASAGVKSYSPSNRFSSNTNKPATKVTSYSRNNSNDSRNNRMSPSYNYNYKRNQNGVNSANTGVNNSNTNKYGLKGTGATNTTNTRINSRSPVYSNLNNKNRVSPGSNVNRVSPGQNGRVNGTTTNSSANRVSPGSRFNNFSNNSRNNSNSNVNKTGTVNQRGMSNNNRNVSVGSNNSRNNSLNRNNSNSNRPSYAQPLKSNVNAQNRTNIRNQSPSNNNTQGNRYANQSPGTRYNNYMNQNKKPGNTQGPIVTKQVPNQFNDKHLANKGGAQNKDLDSRLDRLQGLLNKARK